MWGVGKRTAERKTRVWILSEWIHFAQPQDSKAFDKEGLNSVCMIYNLITVICHLIWVCLLMFRKGVCISVLCIIYFGISHFTLFFLLLHFIKRNLSHVLKNIYLFLLEVIFSHYLVPRIRRSNHRAKTFPLLGIYSKD